MATSFFYRKPKTGEMASLWVRARSRTLKLDHKIRLNYDVDMAKWDTAHESKTEMTKYKKDSDVKAMFDILDIIEKELDYAIDNGKANTLDEAKAIVNNIIFGEQIRKNKEAEDEAARLEAEKNRMTLRKYIDIFRKEIKSGARLTDRGTVYASGTINAINQACERLKKFEAIKKHIYDFDEIDFNFYKEYTAYLNNENYSINTTGKCIKQLKAIMASAESEGFHNNVKYKDKKFKGARIDVDSIYLTKEDLDAMMRVDLSKKSYGYDLARDIFMIGVWTAQRVSDYNNIKPGDIQTIVKRSIVDVPDPEHPGQTREEIQKKEITVINIRQQKTGAKVAIPCSSELKRILEKYNYEIPRLSDQNINDNIKKVGEWAGLTEEIPIVTTKGGKPVTEMIPKYKLIHSHTARRTGATLMYLAGMEIYDIMKITGHSTPQMLKKYIKADELEVVEKITDKYNYFD